MVLRCCANLSHPNTAADAFLPILTGDIEAAQSLVVLSCESLQYMKGTLAKALQPLGIRGVECCILSLSKAFDKDSRRDCAFLLTTEQGGFPKADKLVDC